MLRNYSRFLTGLAVLSIALMGVWPCWGQGASTGTITVTVVDPSGGVVPDAELMLTDLETNNVRKATTNASGTYSFVNLPLGTYSLMVNKKGFEGQTFASVVVHATQVTDVSAKLSVGTAKENIVVHESETPLVQTTSNAISTTINVKQLSDLPINGRDVSQLAFLTPGYTGIQGNGNGTWNGLPVIAQGNNIDGVISSTSRMKFSGNQAPVLQARLEDIQEMTVQTDQLNLSTGFGQSDMQVNFVTKRGTNAFHGRLFENFQNTALDANSWVNKADGLPRNHLILNDFGGSLGGPILKNRLFFFGSYAEIKQPGGYTETNQVLTPAAQGGSFFAPGMSRPVQLVGTPTSVAASAGVNNTINARVTQEIANVNKVIPSGTLTGQQGDPNVQNLNWFEPSPITYYFPAVRVDFNASSNVRMDIAWNQTKENQPNSIAPWFPGPGYASSGGEFLLSAYTASFGLEWTISPTLVNQFRGGFLYNYTNYGKGSQPPTVGGPNVYWDLPYPTAPSLYGTMSGDAYQQPTSQYYPLFNFSDSATLQHGSHTFMFGVDWYREQDHYWNAPAGIAMTNLGLVPGDPAFTPMANALASAGANPTEQAEGEQLYAVLTGDIGASNGPAVRTAFSLNPVTKQYQNNTAPFVLDELQKAWGVFFQDSYRMKPSFTLNYGLRWDFTGDDHDLKSAYESAGLDGVWGPSGAGNEFKPGVLEGNINPLLVARAHQYHPWNVSPQPQLGIAWAPGFSKGLLGSLAGSGQTVVRAGFSLRNYTEPYQFFWDAASDYGAFFYQNNQLIDNQQFAPGSLLLQGAPYTGMMFPPYSNVTPNYTTSFPEAGLTFIQPFQQIFNPGIALGAFNPNIRQPYTESWNFGIQREIGNNNAIEIRYIGSHSVHQWLTLFTDETNIFENGFLTQFEQAQKNLALNTAAGVSSFSPAAGVPGTADTPIFDQAFLGLGPTDPGGYGSTQFISFLQNGAAGAAATALAGGPGGNPTYYCNLVNQSQFPASVNPCTNNVGYTGPGGPYPINFFQMNPYESGQDVGYMTAAGHSNYNALQVDFRQKQWHGMQFDVNYTWSHTLGINTNNSWTGVFNQYTMRDLGLSYGPLPFDVRHSVHANGTYDLPFGSGKRYLNSGGIVNRVVGGWTVGTIIEFQTGEPFELQGAQFLNGVYSSTYNDFADPGIVLNGVSRSQLQNSVGVYRIPVSTWQANGNTGAAPFVDIVNPAYLANSGTGGGSNLSLIAPNTTPGTIGQLVWLHGPRYFNEDFALTKRIPIRENILFNLQAEMLNAYNHPNFGFNPPYGGANINGFTFATAGPLAVPNSPTDGARQLELRANLEF